MIAIEIAEKEVGIHEATGRNDGIPADKYMRGDKLAWCAGFVLYCFDESENEDIWDAGLGDDQGKKSDYWKLRNVATMRDYLEERGFFFGRNLPPQRNDIIFFGNRAGSDASKSGTHVGIVSRFDGGTISTVEGNLGNAVKKSRHEWGAEHIIGFARLN